LKGKFVLIPFPYTNLTATKLRPALVLFEGERDVVVVFISSRVPQKPALTDVVIEESHSEFALTGLKMSSVIRLDKIATILKDLVVGEIGELGGELKREVNLRLRKVYRL